MYGCTTIVKYKDQTRWAGKIRKDESFVSLALYSWLLPVRSRFYSAPSLGFSAAGAIGEILLFWINSFSAARSFD
jgi:hypothetical protein